ncbi:MAG: putative outer membrane protein precursor [Betaproteobacteria bacterium]|nr:putative outer membrane protein precursor [Betaproteobacteria bacterium]
MMPRLHEAGQHALLIFIATFAACTRTDTAPAPKPAAPASAQAPAAATQPDYQAAVERARTAIENNKLTALSTRCLSFIVSPPNPEGRTVVDVHEKHDAACGGDPATSPRVLSIEIDRSGALYTDANSPGGERVRLK